MQFLDVSPSPGDDDDHQTAATIKPIFLTVVFYL